MNKSLVIVTPVYEDVEAAVKLFQQLRLNFGDQIYIVAVDDGSIKCPISSMDIEGVGIQGVVLKLKHNGGHQKAIAIGLSYVADKLHDFHHVVVMDSDGEDTPESIKSLIEVLDSTGSDIVVAKRKKRVETLKFRAFYIAYKWIFKLLSGREISFGNFMVLKLVSLKRLITMQEIWLHTAGCVLMSKLRIGFCELDRGVRYSGQSKMNFVGLVLHGFKGLMVFAEDVLVRVGIACALVASMSVIGIVIAVSLKMFGFATPGWFSIVSGILVLVFMQTGALTLMSLMMTGVMKSGGMQPIDYNQFIKEVQQAK